MKYIHLFTFQFPTKIATYTFTSENRVLSFANLEQLADEQNIDLSTDVLLNHTVFLNEENN